MYKSVVPSSAANCTLCPNAGTYKFKDSSRIIIKSAHNINVYLKTDTYFFKP